MTRTRILLVFAAVLVLTTAALALDDFAVRWQAIGTGAGWTTGGDLSLTGTAGQVGTGTAGGGSFQVAAGYWNDAVTAAPLHLRYLPLMLHNN